MDEDLPYVVGFSAFPGIGPLRFRLLVSYFGSARKAWEAPYGRLIDVGLGQKRSTSFDRFRKDTDPHALLASLRTEHIHVLSVSHPKYPERLRQIPDAPIVLYVKGCRGKQPIDVTRTVAVVGTRRVSRYGAEVTERLVAGLVSAGCTIVSGMAYGVDAIAHRTALSQGGSTIAVLGCGVDVIAPASNALLYQDIVTGGRGAVVSEMPPGMRPDKGLFPARNRIISGLSLGVVVIEGAEDSGALITAARAAEQGREVFAVPGPITSVMSRGPAILIKNGATLVESADDVLDALNLTKTHAARTLVQTRSPDEQRIIALLQKEHLHVDDIVRRSGLTVSGVTAILTVLELNGLVKDTGEKIYAAL